MRAKSNRRLAAFWVAAAACAALHVGSAFAVEPANLDLGPVLTHVMAQAGAATDKKLVKAYNKLVKSFTKASSQDFASRLKALSAAAKSSAGTLRADGTLADLLDAAIHGADLDLESGIDAMSDMIGRVPVAARTKAETFAMNARTVHVEGHTFADTRDRVDAVKDFLTATSGYAKATAAAVKAMKKAGELPTTLTPQPNSVYTILGTGRASGFNGDGRSARRTIIYNAEDVEFGPDGKLYFLDWNNHLLRRLENDGTIARVCGAVHPAISDGIPFDARLNHPANFCFEPRTDGTLGKIYIAAWHNHRVLVFDPNLPTPFVYTIAGTTQGFLGDNGLATKAKFNLISGVLLLPDGDMIVSDSGNQVIRKIKLSEHAMDKNSFGRDVETGTVTTIWGQVGVQANTGDGGLASDAGFAFSKFQSAQPDGRMRMNAAGDVFILSGAGHCVRKVSAADGKISTFAGTGVQGYSGDGGLAKDCQLDTPEDVAIAPDGTVYISDSKRHVIRVVDPSGIISTYAGTGVPGYSGDEGPRLSAQFHEPSGLVLDAAGNLYVADRLTNTVRVITSAAPGDIHLPVTPYFLPEVSKGRPPAPGPSGQIDTYVGKGELGFNGDGKNALDTQLYWPQDITVQPSTGLVYFVDWNNHRIRMVDTDGKVQTVVGSGEVGDTFGLATQVQMNHPADIVFHPTTGSPWDGDLIVASWHTDKVMRVDNTGQLTSIAGDLRGFSGDKGPARDCMMSLASCVKFDSQGNWYICDQSNRRIRYVDNSTGKIDTILGNGTTTPLGEGGPAAAAGLNVPVGTSAQPSGKLCLDPTEKYLYFAESDGHRIRRLDLTTPDRTVTTIAGTGVAGYSGDDGPAVDATFSSPTDVDCDAAGNVYVADRDNHVIRKIDIATGKISTYAGSGYSGYAGDGGPATAALFNSPSGLFVDRSNGRVYVADTLNSVLRVIW